MPHDQNLFNFNAIAADLREWIVEHQSNGLAGNRGFLSSTKLTEQEELAELSYMLRVSGDDPVTIRFVAASLREMAGVAVYAKQVQVRGAQLFRERPEEGDEGDFVDIVYH